MNTRAIKLGAYVLMAVFLPLWLYFGAIAGENTSKGPNSDSTIIQVCGLDSGLIKFPTVPSEHPNATDKALQDLINTSNVNAILLRSTLQTQTAKKGSEGVNVHFPNSIKVEVKDTNQKYIPVTIQSTGGELAQGSFNSTTPVIYDLDKISGPVELNDGENAPIFWNNSAKTMLLIIKCKEIDSTDNTGKANMSAFSEPDTITIKPYDVARIISQSESKLYNSTCGVIDIEVSHLPKNAFVYKLSLKTLSKPKSKHILLYRR